MKLPSRFALMRLLVLSLIIPSMALFLSDTPASAQPLPLDHFMCYRIGGTAVGVTVGLVDQFGSAAATVGTPAFFCNPAEKTTATGGVTPIQNEAGHLKWYNLSAQTAPTRSVVVRNQFGGQQTLKVTLPRWLAVPTQKDSLPPPERLDHFKCYTASGTSVNATVTLEDQFQLEKQVSVLRPIRFCNPVQKTHLGAVTQIQNPDAHLVCYDVVKKAALRNQFRQENHIFRKVNLCVPTLKLSHT